MKRKFTLTLVAVVTAFFVQAQTADEILAKYFAATGGLDKWKEMKTRTSTGTMNIQNMDLPITMYEKAPFKQRMQIKVQNVEIIQAYDGTDAWVLNPLQGGTDPVKMSDEDSKDFKDNELQDEFIDYKAKGHAVELLPSEEIDGVKCYKIQLVKNKNNDKEDVSEIHYFDSENWVPIMYISYARSGPMKGQEVRTFLSDYQEVNGLMFPFFMESKINGQTVQKITVEKMTINDPVEDSIFIFPKK